MADTCPHLDYRREGDDRTFDSERAYCTVAERFVQSMRADICNGKFELDYETDCEIFIEHERAEESRSDEER